MKEKVIKIGLLIICIVLIIGAFISNSTSTAVSSSWSVGKKYYIDTIIDDPTYYCIQRGASLPSGWFTLKNKVTIIGDTATDNWGKTYSGWYNKYFAYILCGNSAYPKGYWSSSVGMKTSRQLAVWNNINGWISRATNSGIKNIGSFMYDGNSVSSKNSQDLEAEARRYANSKSVAGVKFTKSPASTSNNKAGPYQLSYSGTISSIEIKDTDGNAITTGISYCYVKDGKEVSASATEIPSGVDFYIINTSNQPLGSISVNVKSTAIKVNLYFLYKSGTQNVLGADGIDMNYPVTKSVSTPINSTAKLKLVKQDAHDDSILLEGSKFVLSHNNKYAKSVETKTDSEGTYYRVTDWTTSYESGLEADREKALAEAYRFGTNANGEVRIEVLRDDNTLYALTEVESTKGYVSNLDCLYASGVNLLNVEWKNIGEKVVNGLSDKNPDKIYFNLTDQGSIKLVLTNPHVLSLSGYVWIDVPNTKANNYNSLYDGNVAGINAGDSTGNYEGSHEMRLQGVTVNLREKTGDKKIIATTETNENGEYFFEEVIIKAYLENYYMEFDYSTLENGKYKKYIPVAFNSTDANGSRALYDTVAKADDNLTGIVSTYAGTDEESKYGLSSLMGRFYNEDSNYLENINLGIKQLPDTDYKINENIAEVNVTMKGYTYKYVYGGNADKSLINAPTVNWQLENNIAAYTRAIYPSDIAYDKQNGTEELKVDVKYRIDVTNTTMTNIEELYQEQYLTVTELTNEFDTHRYTLKDTENWTDNGNGTATAKKSVLNGLQNIPKLEGDTKNYATTYITFSINHDALLEILDKEKNPNGIIEKFPTKATAKAYHTYTRTDYGWGYDNITKKNNEHTTTSQTREDDAPYLILELGETRKVQGIVFEDGVVTTNGEVLGDGQYGNKENVVSNVNVDLLDVDRTTISTLYNVNEKGKIITKTDESGVENLPKATTTTGEKGSFVLEGMVPGEYYLRFTYADGSQKVCTFEGKEITDIDLSKYKSTIVTSDKAKTALKAEAGDIEDKKWTWYKYLEGTNYSVAVDDLEQKGKYNDKTATSVYADTARTSITIESTKDNSIQIKVTDNGQSAGQNEKFVGFNFGIIRQPIASATIEKVISNVRLINSQNNVVFDGDPTKDTLAGVSDLSAESSELGSTFTRIEINENELYGATLTITYTIRITNTSEVNYYGKNYYWFGEDKINEVTLSIDEISDYLDNKLVFESCNYPTEVTTEEDRQLVRITNIGELYTIKNIERKETKKMSTDVILTAKRTLSSEDDDMEFVNTVKFKTITNSGHPDQKENNGENGETPKPTTDTYRAVPQPEITDESQPATVTVTPPTGGDRQSVIIYTMIGIAALVVLSTGIVIIKKKIL